MYSLSSVFRHSLLFSLILLLAVSLPAATLKVNSTRDRGEGSLRQAINEANSLAGPDTIIFNIPKADSAFSSAQGVWTIRPQSTLTVLIDDSTCIDGTSQSKYLGEDTNPAGPEIEIDGTSAGDGLYILSGYNTVRHLIINRCSSFGIDIQESRARGNRIQGCFIGLDASGTQALGNRLSGIMLYFGPKQNVIGGRTPEERNIISGNGWAGVEIQSLGADSNLVIGNFIGTDVTGRSDLGNTQSGVYVWSGPAANVIGGAVAGEGNLVSGNGWFGIEVGIGSGTVIKGNYIGTDRDGVQKLGNDWAGISMSNHDRGLIGGTEPGAGNLICGNDNGISLAHVSNTLVAGNRIGTALNGDVLGNAGCGIKIFYKATSNIIGPGNVITGSGSHGVLVDGDSTIHNIITANSIYANSWLGIETSNGGNLEVSPPVITGFTGTFVTGLATAGSRVEIFSDDDRQGRIYEGFVAADPAGNFLWTGTAASPRVTATATDSDGNTSEFSAPLVTSADLSEQGEGPEQTSLAQNYPNPFNHATSISFSIARTVHVRLQVFDTAGNRVAVLVDRTLAPGLYKVRWNAVGLPSGTYWCRLQAGETVSTRRMIFIK